MENSGNFQGFLKDISCCDIQGIYFACYVYEVLVLRYKVSVSTYGSGWLLFSWLGGWAVGGLKSKLLMKLVAIDTSLKIECVRL